MVRPRLPACPCTVLALHGPALCWPCTAPAPARPCTVPVAVGPGGAGSAPRGSMGT